MAKDLYRVKLSTRLGAKEIVINAETEASARLQAARSGTVLRVTKTRRPLWRVPLSEADRHTLLTRLSAMLASRVGVAEALRLLRDTFGGKISKTSGDLLHYVEASGGLPEAMQQIGPPDFPDSLTALVRAGARAGNTATALADAVAFEQQIREVKKSASKGLMGALFGFLTAVATILFSSFYFGPEVLASGLISANSKSVHVGWIFTVGDWTGYFAVGLIVFSVPLFLLATLGRQIAPVSADRLILHIPFYREIVLARGNFITLYGLAMLVNSGVNQSDALLLAQDTAVKGALRNDLKLAYAEVKAGRPWAKVMHTLHPTDKAALLSALDNKQIAHTLMALANQYKEIYAQRLNTFVPALTLVSALLLTIAGGVLFGEVILPMLQASNGMLGG